MKRLLISITAMTLFCFLGTDAIAATPARDENMFQAGTETVTALRLLNNRSSDRTSYMGMVSLNPGFLCINSQTMFVMLPDISLRTSHGAFFPRSGIYLGGEVEYSPSMYNVLNVDPHLRYIYCTKRRVSGYVGAEAGATMLFDHSFGVIFNAGLEVGLMVNFSKVSLDIGVRTNVIPLIPLGNACFIRIPLHIGIVF